MLTKDRLVQYSAASLLRGEMAGEVIGLYDMLTRFALLNIASVYQTIDLTVIAIEKELYSGRVNQPSPELGGLLKRALSILESNPEAIELGNVRDYYATLELALRAKSDMMRINDILRDIRTTIRNEFDLTECYVVSRDSIKYLRPEMIPDVVRDHFQQCIVDLEQANKCLAFGLDAACVYHCNCILQAVVGNLATTIEELGGSIDSKSTGVEMLGKVINKLDTEIKQLQENKKSEQRNQQLKSLSELCAHARAVKWAWRDDNAHGRNVYAPGVAKDILDNITKFVTYLSEIAKGSQS